MTDAVAPSESAAPAAFIEVSAAPTSSTLPFAVVSGGVLTVTDTSGHDFIRASIANNVLSVRLYILAPLTFNIAGAISRIIVNTLAGNDNITMASSVNRPTSLNDESNNHFLVYRKSYRKCRYDPLWLAGNRGILHVISCLP